MLQLAPQIGGEQARAFDRPAGRCAQRAWHNPIAIRPTPIEEIVLIPVIAGKQFVASLARQHNLHMLGRQLGDEVQRNARRPCDRLVFVPYEFRQRIEKILHADGDFVMIGADGFRDLGARSRVRCTAALAIAHRKRLHRLGTHSLHQRGDGARIHAAAEKHAERNVAHEPHSNRLFEPRAALRRSTPGRCFAVISPDSGTSQYWRICSRRGQ